jgi:hypothetical protein
MSIFFIFRMAFITFFDYTGSGSLNILPSAVGIIGPRNFSAEINP